jgi:protein-L-isoaspartate(D-aspartate) O-methyltransferase
MLLMRRTGGAAWPASFVSRAAFVACVAPQDVGASERLTTAFSGAWNAVKSYRTDQPDATCWYAGDGWWLSTREADAVAPREP